MIWLPCDSTENLKTELVSYIKKWTGLDGNGVTKYASRLPNRARISVVKPGEKFSSGLCIRVMSATTPEDMYLYTDSTGRDVICEGHEIVLAVQADTRAGRAVATSALVAVLKSIFGCRGGSDERADLVERGIGNLDESVGGIQMPMNDPDNEGDWYTQVINLRCDTETYAN